MATVRVENVYKVFGPKPEEAVRRLQEGASREDLRAEGLTPAVIDASFESKEGETFVVMGLSGSGKSTLIRMLNGILPATSGSVFVDDSDVTQLGPKALRELRSQKMSMVFQHFALFPHRTVAENAAYGLQVRGEDKNAQRERANEALFLVGLEAWGSSYPGQLSGGMKQRVGLARALATDTDVMLMDEAFSALDPLIRREMQDQLIELQHRLHKTIIFITHDLNEAMKLGDRIAMLRDGRIVQIGTAEEILNNPANDYVATFVQDVDRSRVLTASAVMVDPIAIARDGDGVRAAHRRMRENVLTGLYVISGDRRLIGAVTDDELSEAVRAGDRRTLGELASRDVATARASSPVVELLVPCAETRLPLAIVDDAHRLLGVVSRATLLAALGGSGREV
ncbi:MAG: quaternary amine ABC transporter ATP-binding protein [Pseudonocardiaceae bacterium]